MMEQNSRRTENDLTAVLDACAISARRGYDIAIEGTGGAQGKHPSHERAVKEALINSAPSSWRIFLPAFRRKNLHQSESLFYQ